MNGPWAMTGLVDTKCKYKSTKQLLLSKHKQHTWQTRSTKNISLLKVVTPSFLMGESGSNGSTLQRYPRKGRSCISNAAGLLFPPFHLYVPPPCIKHAIRKLGRKLRVMSLNDNSDFFQGQRNRIVVFPMEGQNQVGKAASQIIWQLLGLTVIDKTNFSTYVLFFETRRRATQNKPRQQGCPFVLPSPAALTHTSSISLPPPPHYSPRCPTYPS